MKRRRDSESALFYTVGLGQRSTQNLKQSQAGKDKDKGQVEENAPVPHGKSAP